MKGKPQTSPRVGTAEQVVERHGALYVARYNGGFVSNVSLKSLREQVNRAADNLRFFCLTMKDGKPHAQRIHSNGAGCTPQADDAYECALILHEAGFDVERPTR